MHVVGSQRLNKARSISSGVNYHLRHHRLFGPFPAIYEHLYQIQANHKMVIQGLKSYQRDDNNDDANKTAMIDED